MLVQVAQIAFYVLFFVDSILDSAITGFRVQTVFPRGSGALNVQMKSNASEMFLDCPQLQDLVKYESSGNCSHNFPCQL
jgi:hypothetical protein